MPTIVSLFKEAVKLIEHKHSLATMTSRELASSPATDQHRLYLHAEYHPRGIPRPMILQHYNHTLLKTKLFDDFIVAYHQPKNLRDFFIENKTAELALGSNGHQTCELYKIGVKSMK
jgi:hypothetical protein